MPDSITQDTFEHSMHYIFDRTVRSDITLQELRVSKQEQFDITVKTAESLPADTSQFTTAFDWLNADGRVICKCQRKGTEYLISFPGHADFHISENAIISCVPQPGCSDALLRHLLLNQIIPRYLGTSGELMLHASAVTLPDGRCIAFLGNSGYGKSTLASYFHRHGARLIDDDCILLKPARDKVHVMGGVPSIRLFPDSVQAVFGASKNFNPYMTYSEKQQMILEREPNATATEQRFLDALFVLNSPACAKGHGAVTIEPLSGKAAIMNMINSTFSLDPSDRKTIAQNFRNSGGAITDSLQLYSLNYPRQHAYLFEVYRAVTRCLQLT